MQSFSRLSVGTRLSALLTLVIATSLGLLALTIYRQSAGDIESQVKAELRSSTRLMQQSVAMYDVTSAKAPSVWAACSTTCSPPARANSIAPAR